MELILSKSNVKFDIVKQKEEEAVYLEIRMIKST